jgi:hypothetical protein
LALADIQGLSRRNLLPVSAAMRQTSYGRHGMERKQKSIDFIAGWNCINYRYNVSTAGARCT